jgi:predicted Zn-dependent peptidase
VASVLDECRRLAAEPLPAEELERVRQVCLFDLEFSRDSAYEVANRMAWGELVGLPRTLDEERREVEAVRAEDVQATARDIFRAANLNLVLVGPLPDAMKSRIRSQALSYGTATR